jgi:CheY-like chemotaxis protein
VTILLVEDDEVCARALRRALDNSYELREVGTLAAALEVLQAEDWAPELIIADINLPDSKGAGTAEALQRASPGTPLIIGTGLLTDALRRQVESLAAIQAWSTRRGSPGISLRDHEMLRSRPRLPCAEFLDEIDNMSRHAAETAVDQAMERLAKRLGLGDDEGVRMAVRLARGWEATKGRFLGAFATGIASAILLALGAGLRALLETRAQR